MGMTKHEAVEILEEVKMLDDSMFAYSQAYNDALEMAIEALKAQDPVEPIQDMVGDALFWVCGKCGHDIRRSDWYCANCGKAVKWE